jgi:GT2 family glycosyltransferase
LQKFLPTVVRTNHPRFEIILADNASTDGSSEWVKTQFPDVNIVNLDKNYGYCGGNNRAVKHARYDTLVFLNNDVAVDPDWLNSIDIMLADNPDIAAVQPKIRSFNQPDHFEYAGAAGGFIDTMGFPFCRGRIFDTLEKDRGQYNTASPIFWASGAALVIRKDIFVQLDGFYEPFEFHMEEIDLCWRIQLLGKQIWYCPDSLVYHLGGGSLPSDDPRKTFYNFRNNLIMIARNLPEKWRFFIILNRLELDGLAGFQFLFKGQFKNIFAIIKAHFAFYGHLGQIHSWRRSQDVSKFKPLNNLPGTLNGSVIMSYFLAGHKTWEKVSKSIVK